MNTRCQNCKMLKPCGCTYNPGECEIQRQVIPCASYEELIRKLREMAGTYDPYRLHEDLEREAANAIEKLTRTIL